MFAICSQMKWAHLPVEGGIYDQDPELLRYFQVIWHEQGEYQAEEERKREAQHRKNKGASSPGVRRPSRTPRR